MILLIDKPKGRTSFDVVKKIRNKQEGKTKVGHSGTLDPMATGLLVIGTDKDTKSLADIQKLDKEYIANIDFSVYTDTWDMDYHNSINYADLVKTDDGLKGIRKSGKFIKAPNIEDINNKLDMIIPEFNLPLPDFSAKKIKGKKSYDLARAGKTLNREQVMKIISYEILSYDFPNLEIKITVGSGTYIRSIAYWLGKEFDLYGTLSYLRRTRVGLYKVEDAKLI